MEAQRILVISAGAGAGQEFVQAFSQQGFSVETVHGVAAALQLIGKRTFDVVLAELSPPGASDLWSLEQLKSAWPASEILVFAECGVEGSAKQAAVLDLRGLLPRPLAPAGVTSLLGLATPAASADQPPPTSWATRISRIARNIGLFLAAPFTATFYTLALPFVAAYVFGRNAREALRKKRLSR